MSTNNGISKGRLSNRLTAYSFLLPAVAVFTFVILYPTLSGFYLSFTDWGGMRATYNFIGIKNYIRLFRDEVFYISIRNTTYLTICTVIIQNALAMFLAVMANSKAVAGRNFFRTVYFIPSLLSIIIVGYTWLYILNPNVGIFGMLLRVLEIEKVSRFDLLVKPFTAMGVIIFTFVWQFSGYNMVIYLAGLQAIPTSLYESADIDGATFGSKFRHITLPLLIPSITINVFLNLTGCLKAFEQIYVMTKGGPGNATETIGTFIYNTAFSGFQFGYGTAISTILFLIILIVTTIQVRFTRSLETEL